MGGRVWCVGGRVEGIPLGRVVQSLTCPPDIVEAMSDIPAVQHFMIAHTFGIREILLSIITLSQCTYSLI